MTDYIIIGAGSAGCVLANRLSADPAVKVTLLEAGGKDSSPFIHMPAGYRHLMTSGVVDWGYHTVPQKHCYGRSFAWPRGKVLGGSSSVNGMVYIRGDASDFDHWAQLGNPGWSYADVLPYFKRSESWDLGEDKFHGGSGPLRTSRLTEFHPLAKAWMDAGEQAGYPRNPDVNGASQEGFGPLDSTIGDGRRSSTAFSYLKPALKRPNITVITHALTTRIIVKSGRAVGVEYVRNGRTETLMADREVLLSGGAINSPQLLQLSGIGAGDHLNKLGIKVVHEVEGVGQNLSDHVSTEIQQVCLQPISLLRELKPWNVARHLLRYAIDRGGPVAHPGIQAVTFLKTRPEVVAPDIQIHFIMIMYGENGTKLHEKHGFQPLISVQRPESLGTVMITSTDPSVQPAIDPNYLASNSDVITLREGIKLAREVIAQKAFDPYRGEELNPGPKIKTDAEIDEYVRRTAHTQFHPVGTCKMGHDATSVVDSELKVHGLDGLRVIDASVMPAIVSANTNAAVIMIAEKVSDMILGRQPLVSAA